MKNVLVLLHDDDGQEARLQVALDLTRAISGHLVCLDVLVPPELLTDYFTGAGGAMVLDDARRREDKNRASVEARLQREDVPWSMLETSGFLEDQLTAETDLADIIVATSPGEHDDSDARHILGELVVKSDRPILAVPRECRRFDATGSALVAWNGSHEANQVLRSSVALLQKAASVTLFEVNNPDGGFAAEDAASYLSRHGVHPKIVEQSTRGPISDAILEKARETGAAYIVLGAYGLPRAIEAVFGGVTNGILRKSDRPILLAH